MKKSVLTVLAVFSLVMVSCNDPKPDPSEVTVVTLSDGNCKATYQGRETIASCSDINDYLQLLQSVDEVTISFEGGN